MKIYKRHKALVIESEVLVKIAGFLSAGKKGWQDAKAAAFIPFVFVRSEKYATPVFINHERIHFYQQIETLVVGMLVIQIFEDIYSRFFLKLKSPDYYLYRAHEQEAYINQENLQYLETRPWFSLFKYVRTKRRLRFIKNQNPRVEVY